MRIVAGTIEVEDVDATVDRLRSIGDRHGCTVAAVDARYVADEAHLRQALRLADRAIDRGEAIAHSRDVELLLYVAATRQIDRAFELGLSPGECPVAVVVDAGGEGGRGANDAQEADTATDREAAAADAVRALVDPEPLEAVAGDEELIRSWFGIDEPELAATEASLADLVLERVALLVVQR